ncbi:MAG: ABC transporter permease [Planctomycetia bacterium]|nr:ABC transporter permease [Planctomycetia bacterium]
MSFAEMKIVVRLTWAHLRKHPGRVFLTVFSTIAAACVVVWVVSGYDALAGKFGEFEEGYLGRYQMIVIPARTEGFRRGSSLPYALVAKLAADARVEVAEPMYQARARIRPLVEPVRKAPQDGERPQRGGRGQRGGPGPGGVAGPGGGPGQVVPGQMVRMGGGGFNAGPTLVGTNATRPMHPLKGGRWLSTDGGANMEGVLTSETAQRFQVKVGDIVLVSQGGLADDAQVTVVGIVDQPDRLPGPSFRIGLPPSRPQALAGGPATSALFVTLATAEELTDQPAEASFIGVILKNGRELDNFKKDWAAKLEAASPGAQLQTQADVSQEIDQSTTFEGVRSQAYAATGISLLAALFIIFTTLSMGVHERIRQFAMLRAVALTKSQIGLMLVLESLGLGLIGWGGGLLAGWGMLKVLSRWHPELLEQGATLGTWCILLSGACAFGGALAASLFPAWQATRIRPLDAMTVQAKVPVRRFPWKTTLCGLLLIAVNPLLIFYVPMPDTMRYMASAAVGYVSMAIGFLLLAPGVIFVTEALFGPILARLLRIHPQLLASQLSTNLWRTLGITGALTLGLGLFVTMQTWGYSMLGPFTPGQWVPDMIAKFSSGLAESNVDEVRHIKGVVAEQCVPLAVEQVKFATDVTGSKVRATASRQDNCVMIGFDADMALGGNKALAGKKPMFDFRYVEGNRQEAAKKLKDGRYCLVPDHFARESGLHVGDKFAVLPPRDSKKPVEYEIAGVVSMDGWHWMSKIGFRNHGGGRAAGLMFCPYQQVKKDFGVDRVSFFWMNLDGTATEAQVQESLEKVAKDHPSERRAGFGRGGAGGGGGGFGGGAGAGAVAAAGAGTGGPAQGDGGDVAEGPPRGFGRGPGRAVETKTAASVRAAIQERASGIIWALCQLPLITLGVTALGVVNTVAASVRARRWEMGVLRAMGTTRGGILRMIVAEGMLIGLAACLLSLAFGVMSGYCGTGVTRYVNVRGGMVTSLIIPWEPIGIGFAITLGMCLIAAIGPALLTARRDTLSLLSAGRGVA